MSYFTPLRDPDYTDYYRVQAYAGCLLQSNNPPMPVDMRMAAAIQHAWCVGVRDGIRSEVARRRRLARRRRQSSQPRRATR